VQYNQTSLERAYKHELLTEHDLGVHIDLINPATYKVDYNGEWCKHLKITGFVVLILPVYLIQIASQT
jgi:hypothetical protein